MKPILIALSLAALSLSAAAQERSISYEKTVFSNSQRQNNGVSKAGVAQLQQLQKNFPGWQGYIDPAANSLQDLYGPAMNIPGNQITDKAQYCFDNYLTELGITKAEWTQTRNINAPHASFNDYKQYINGHEVLFTRIGFRFTPKGDLSRVQLKNYGHNTIGQAPVTQVADALKAATSDITASSIASGSVDANWVWFPVPVGNGYELHPAWSFTVTGANETGTPFNVTGYVDGTNNQLLYRTNDVKETSLTIKAPIYKTGTLNPLTIEPLANLAITVGATTTYTDTLGLWSNTTTTFPVYANVSLTGKWSKVRIATIGTPHFIDTITANGTTRAFDTLQPTSSVRAVNAYYHVNRVHDFMKTFYPSFVGMDYALATIVDTASGTCNAYYTGQGSSSINFYKAGSGCNSFAEIGDIIYHEYGHGISDKFYNAQGAGTITNGALNEANSDIWAISVTHNPILGQNCFTGQPASYIRRYDQTPQVYPKDIVGEVHTDGEIIAGAWWDVAVNLNSVDSMSQLFTKTYYQVPNGPNGTEGAVYHEVLIAALMDDDNDANLANGTPHFVQIVTAFAKHGIYLLGDAVLTHTELAHQAPGATPTVTASLVVGEPAFFQDLKIFYRKRGAITWDSLTMTNSNFTFTAQLPAQQTGTIVDYYFKITDILASGMYWPSAFDPTATASQTSLPYQYGTGISAKNTVDFETPATNWQIGNISGDAATKGIWIQATPIGSTAINGNIVQVGYDHTSGTGKCLVTGNAASATSSVTSAALTLNTTTVISPVFDVSSFSQPVVEYYRWFSNDRGNNPRQGRWTASIKDSTVSTLWYNVDNTYQSDYNWRRKIFSVNQYIASPKYIQMRFVAATNSATTATLVEAALDDFIIYDKNQGTGVGGENAPVKSRIFPNPTSDKVNIILGTASNSGAIIISDVTGKQLMKLAINAGTLNYEISTKQLAAGQYVLTIQSEKLIQSTPLTVVR